MKKQNKKTLKKKQEIPLKTKIELVVLVVLILLVPLTLWFNLFQYGYYYLKCEDRPAEVFGNYYRIPVDKGYGIHPGSDYSNCSWSGVEGKTRDPAVLASQDKVSRRHLEANYDVYLPHEYIISEISESPQGSNLETTFKVTSKSGTIFTVREINKDSDFSYTDLCTKPASENWSGTLIGNDAEGRGVCRVNISKYIKDYIVGINIGKTAIMLRTAIGPEEQLNAEAIDILSSMKPLVR